MSGWSVTATSIVVPQIIIGEHIVTTDPASGALLTAPVIATEPVPPTPAIDIAQIVEQVLSANVEIPGLSIMPLKSLLSVLVGRVSGAESAISDISGVRIPAIVTEQLSNSALDAAREAAQALIDAAQDASAALVALNAASASNDIAAVAGRVGVLEAAAPSYALASDLSSTASALDGRISALESAPGFDAAPLIASIADLSGSLLAVDGRVAVLEGHDVYVESVVSAAIAVATADAATALAAAGSAAADAALADAKAVQAQSTADGAASAASAAASAASAAQADASSALSGLAGKADKGLNPSVHVYVYDTALPSAEEATAGTPQAAAGAAAAEGKLVAVKTAGANATRNMVTLPAGTPAAGDRRAFLNIGVDPLEIKDSAGSVIAELLAGEGGVLVYVDGGWVLEAGFQGQPNSVSPPSAVWAAVRRPATSQDVMLYNTMNGSNFDANQIWYGVVVEVTKDGERYSGGPGTFEDGNGNQWFADVRVFYWDPNPSLHPDNASYQFINVADSSGVTHKIPITSEMPPPPSYPAAWASLPTGGYTAVRRAVQPSDTPAGFSPSQLYSEGILIEIKDSSAQPISTQTNYIWYEVVSGKEGAGSPGVAGTEGFFVSIGSPLASFSYVLISVGGVDASDAGVTYRVPISDM